MIEVLHYDLEIEILPHWLGARMPDAPGQILVACSMRVRNGGHEPVRSLKFVIYRLLRVSAASDGTGSPPAVHQTLHAVEGKPELQVGVVHVELAHAIPPGQSRDLRLDYEGRLVGYREAMPYVHDSVRSDCAVLRPEVLWYPVAGDPTADIIHRAASVPVYGATVRCPEGWWAALAGARREHGAEGPVRFLGDNWSGGFYLVAGRYSERAGGEHVAAHHLPGHEAWAEAVIEAGSFAASTLGGWLGPWAARSDRLEVVEIPEHWGSQATPGLILQTHRSDPRLIFTEVAHEVAHHWTPGRDPHRFCDEGFAHYFQALVEGARFGDTARWTMLSDYYKGLLGDQDTVRIPLAQAADHPAQLQAVARQKGPLALTVLHAGLGDAAFFGLVRAWIGSEAAQAGTAADFGQHVRRETRNTPFDGDRFVREWFEGSDALPTPLPVEGPFPPSVAALAGRYRTGTSLPTEGAQ